MKLIAKAEKNRSVWFILLASFVFFLLRLPSLFEPYWYGDEGIYQVLGIAIRQGRFLYTDAWDNKPPFLYLLYALFNSDQFAVRLVSIVFGILAVLAFFALSKKLFQSKQGGQNLAVITTSLFTLLFGLPLLEGNIANAENFMLFPIILAALFIFNLTSTIKKSYKMLAFSGLLLGVSFLFKIVAVFDFAAFFVFILFVSLPIKISLKTLMVRKNLESLVPPLIFFSAAFFIPIIISAVFFLTAGAAKEFLQATFVQNVGYVGYGNKLFIPQGFLIFKLTLLTLFTIFLFNKRAKFSKTTLFILLWFSFSLFNAYLSQRPYTHYLLVLLPSFSLLLGLIFMDKKYQLINLVILIIALLFIVKDFNFYGKTVFYYQNFMFFIRGRETVSSYQAFFDRKTPIDYQIAEYIKTKTTSKDDVFIWGNNAQVYALSDKLPPGKYAVAYHITSYKDGMENTQKALTQKKPKLIIVMPGEGNFPFPLYYYDREVRIDNAIIYERIF